MNTNRICRNYAQAGQDYFGCTIDAGGIIEHGRRLQEDPGLARTLVKNFKRAHAAIGWVKENDGRRLIAGDTEAQLLERISAAQDEDECEVLAELCKLPEGVDSMVYACTCNGQRVGDVVSFNQGDMDWVCPQPISQ